MAAILAIPFLFSYAPESSVWARLCALPVVLLLLWGALPLFMRRLGAERLIWLSFPLLALVLSTSNRPLADFVGSYKSVKNLARTLERILRPEDVLAQYRVFRPGLCFYAKRRTVQVEEI